MNLSNMLRLFSIATCGVGLGLLATSGQAQPQTTVDRDAIRPFHINVPDEALADLRRRVAATKWPERELVGDATQGVQLATMQRL
ncbi:MAG TPA: epoxide hydrolase N-terminal domain-containing protein, partial [Bryobacteraceae bacterium]|nr:epoxide hydrolase N-terminal domain-containing protein [Bryobacteraceae bacterium]